MSAEARDEIYVEIEAERLREAREDSAEYLTYIEELVRLKSILDLLIARAATRRSSYER